MAQDQMSLTEHPGDIIGNQEGAVAEASAYEELRQLLIQAVAQLSRRLDNIEERIKGQSGPITVEEMEQTLTSLKQLVHDTSISPTPAKAYTGEEGTVHHIFPELQRQVLYLETQIGRACTDIKLKVDERYNALREKHEIVLKQMDRTTLENQRYVNRHLFYLAILLILAIIVGGAFIETSVDRLSTYLTGQIDSVNRRFDQMHIESTTAGQAQTEPNLRAGTGDSVGP